VKVVGPVLIWEPVTVCGVSESQRRLARLLTHFEYRADSAIVLHLVQHLVNAFNRGLASE
jgi:hypothetical protein